MQAVQFLNLLKEAIDDAILLRGLISLHLHPNTLRMRRKLRRVHTLNRCNTI